jgi:hypothetical protein
MSSISSTMISTVLEDQDVELDCRKSSYNDGSPGNFSFRLIKDVSLPVSMENSTGVFVFRYENVGDYRLKISAEDAEGKVSQKEAPVLAQCNSVSTPILISDISVTATDKRGYLNYNAIGVSGGLLPYKYGWDFNGDARPDQHVGDPEPWTFWKSESSASQIYSLFGGTRSVKSFSKSMPLPRISAGSPAIKDPNSIYYVQTDISPVSPEASGSSAAPWSGVDYVAHLPNAPPDNFKHVYCTYRRDVSGGALTGRATLKVTSQHTYGPTTSATTKHGFKFDVNNISDNGAPSGPVSVGSPVLESARYTVAESPDAIAGYELVQVGNCQLNLRMEAVIATSSCEGSPLPQTRTMRFVGDFSCPLLRSGSLEVSATEGKFYCEAGEYEHCAGGPGGGGPGTGPPGQ